MDWTQRPYSVTRYLPFAHGTLFSIVQNVERAKEMDVLFDVIQRGNLKIELSVQREHGYIVIITANDEEDRRVFRAPILENGQVKTFESPEAAMVSVKNRLLSAAPRGVSDEGS